MTAFSVLVVMVSVYIMAGRYAMTHADDWVEEFETLLADATGIPVRIGSLEGGWQGLGPVLTAGDVRLTGPGGASVLSLSRVSLSLDMPASLLEWQWMAGRIQLHDLDLTIREQQGGRWQLDGLGLVPARLSPEEVFRVVSRLGDLEVLDTRVRFVSTEQRELQFDDLALMFQSRGGRHHLQANGWLSGDPRRITVQAALEGHRLDALSGTVYARLPENDLGLFAGLMRSQNLQLRELEAGMRVRADLSQSRLESLDVDLQMPDLSVYQHRTANTITLEDLAGKLHYRRDGEEHRVRIDGLRLERDGDVWRSGSSWLEWQADQGFRFRSEQVDLGILGGLLRDLELVPDAVVDELDILDPRGSLESLEVNGDLQAGEPGTMSLSGNLRNARVEARGKAPAVWGADGYVELLYTGDDGQMTGFLDVDADDLGLHLPLLFDDAWIYDHVNGRINVRMDTLDGFDMRISSSVITLSSDLIDGRVQFAVTHEIPADGAPRADLELMVGALRGDASGKSAYLPMGPEAPSASREALAWVDRSVLDGEVAGSGFVYRGKVLGESSPPERTMQMFYSLRDGALQFDPEWPALEDINGLVVVDGRDVDVDVRNGSSLGIRFSETRAEVRANREGEGSWLTVRGQGRGTAPQGMEYLRATPVTEGLGNYLAGWETSGDIDFTLDLELPLFVENASPLINLALAIEDNAALVSQFQLPVEDINGIIRYSSDSGISSEDFTARVFDDDVDLDLESSDWEQGVNDAMLHASGSVDMEALREWSLIPDIFNPVLLPVRGRAGYDLRIDLPQQDGRDIRPALRLSSDTSGVELGFPAPLDKAADEIWPLDMELSFPPDGGSRVQVRLADLASINFRLSENAVESGLLFLGPPGDGVRVRRFDDSASGLQILGRLPEVPVRDWLAYYDEYLASTETAPGITDIQETAALVDVNIDSLDIFDKVFRNVNVQIDPGQSRSGLRLALASEHLAGILRFPVEAGMPLVADFSRIHVDPDREAPEAAALPDPDAGSDEERIQFEELEEAEFDLPREDPLSDMDPRGFPAMEFSVEDLQIAGAEFGSWSFRLRPRDDQVVFEDLLIESRGLRIGTEERPAGFIWHHDGESHRSELDGVVAAEDIAQVLSAYGFAPVLESSRARFDTSLEWEGSPAFVSAVGLRGEVEMALDGGRFRSGTGAGNQALKLISIINFDALVRRLRFSDDLLREGLSYDEIRGTVSLDEGTVIIQDQLQIVGPSSLFQLTGSVDLSEQTIDGGLYITLPVSDNLPWVSGLAAAGNLIAWPVAVGIFVLDRAFGDQVDNLASAQYRLEGPWETLEPRLTQVFTTGGEESDESTPEP